MKEQSIFSTQPFPKRGFSVRLPRKLALFASCVVLAVSPFAASARAFQESDPIHQFPEGSFVPNEVLIGLKPEFVETMLSRGFYPQQGKTGFDSLDSLSQKYGVEQIEPVFVSAHPLGQLSLSDPLVMKYGLAGVYKLTFPEGVDIFAVMRELKEHPAVEYAEPNLIYQATTISNDPEAARQWALHNTGQTGGRPDADIDAPEAWSVHRGSPNVLIAILDTGVNYNHPDLAGKVRTDIDRDFVSKDNDAMDDHGHGTYCAGIAAAATGNNVGIAGVCPQCRILPIKVLDADGSGSAETIAQGITYAADAGAKIISMSLGARSNCGCSKTIARAINYAFERGSLLIAASGNDSDKSRISYPAASPRVMSVGASDHHDREASFSNRSTALDILAPGVDVVSLVISGTQAASGTSAATPHVAGVAGLLWSYQPNLTNEQVWWILYQSADDLPSTTRSSAAEPETSVSEAQALNAANARFKVFIPVLSRWRTSFGRLNAHRALTFWSVDRTNAPVDNCQGEFDGCSCAAEATVHGRPNEHADLQLLRAARDRLLARTEVGREWIALYERHRLETTLLIASDSELRMKAQQALEMWMPLFQVLAQGERISNAQAVVTRAHIEAMQGVVEGLMAKGSPGLRADLAKVWQTLQAELAPTKDIREVWQSLSED